MKSTERFSDRVEDYVRYRPHYPLEIIPFLKNAIGLTNHSIIADIGSGTGISSEIFLQNGNKVYAVEPNKEMRQAAEKAFHSNKNFISINGTAEATTLPDHSVDVIVAGQAFHWFDVSKSKKEFQRIATPGAYLVLMWNDRKIENDFELAYEKLLKDFAIDYENVGFRNEGEEKIKELFSPSPVFSHSFANSQSLDFQGLKGRLLSSSYAPREGHPNHKPMLNRLEEIFKKFSVNSKVDLDYSCNVFYMKL